MKVSQSITVEATKFDWNATGGPTVWFTTPTGGDNRIPIIVDDATMHVIACGCRRATLHLCLELPEDQQPDPERATPTTEAGTAAQVYQWRNGEYLPLLELPPTAMDYPNVRQTLGQVASLLRELEPELRCRCAEDYTRLGKHEPNALCLHHPEVAALLERLKEITK